MQGRGKLAEYSYFVSTTHELRQKCSHQTLRRNMSLASKWLQRSGSLYLANPYALPKPRLSHETRRPLVKAPSGGPAGAAPHDRRQGRRTRREAAECGGGSEEL